MSADVTAAALEWLAAGCSPVRAREDGSKRPLGTWKQYQASPPTEADVRSWNGAQGFGLVCGRVSGNLEMLEFEGRAIAEGVLDAFTVKLDAGLRDLWSRVTAGYSEQTPSGGLHACYRLDGEVPGNTKLASRPATPEELAADPDDTVKVLIETRGEGGFTVTAPSGGRTHETGRPWTVLAGGPRSLATISMAERDALHAVARSLDQMPPRAVAAPAGGGQVQPAGTGGRSWHDILVPHGYRHAGADARGHDLWTRPGKDTGTSATTSELGGLYVFSTSTEFEVNVPYSKAAVIAVLDRGMGPAEALATFGTPAEAASAADAELARIMGVKPDGAQVQVVATTQPAPRLNLPDSFWRSLPVLGQIRQGAHSRARSADAVLYAVLARTAAVCPTFLRPDTGLGPFSLNLFAALCGPPASGKTESTDVARALLPGMPVIWEQLEPREDAFADDRPLGSGEGIAELYMGWAQRQDPETGKVKAVREQVRRNAFIYCDEGETLVQLCERSGSTLGSVLRAAWSGATIGQANASIERTRLIPRGGYALGMVAGFQESTIQPLLADWEAGTPQRFVYARATDLSIPQAAPEWPGALALKVPKEGITFAEEVRREIRDRVLARARGTEVAAPLAGHGDLTRAKLAALLVVLDGRAGVTAADWELTRVMWETSCAVRDSMAAYGSEMAAAREGGLRQALAGRKLAEAEALEGRALGLAIATVRRHVSRDKCGGCRRRCLTRAVAGKHLQEIPGGIDDVLERITDDGSVVLDGDVYRPAEAA